MARKKNTPISSICLTLLSTFADIFKSPVFISWMLAVTGIITLTAMSVPKLRATHISAADIQVTFQDPPIWLDTSLLFELQDVARLHLAETTVGREGLIQTAKAMMSTGWFTKVKQVQWISNNHAVVDATFLVPYAIVTEGNDEIFIDAQGRMLPVRAGIIVNPKYHFISIENAMFSKPAHPGILWSGKDIHSALKVLHLIYNKEWATQIQSIDLSTWSSDGSITLTTETPSRLKWGSAPQEELGLEALADDKIVRLNWLHTNFGRIDKGISADFDLTNTSEITIQ